MGLAIGFYLMLTVAFTMYSLHVAGFLKRLYLRLGSKKCLSWRLRSACWSSLTSLFSIVALAYLGATRR